MRRRLIVTGKVQGVWYRDWFVGEAKGLALSGWVRNRRDGSVEALIDGSDSGVTAMIEHAHQGSPASRVAAVAVEEASVDEPLDGFVRRPTA